MKGQYYYPEEAYKSTKNTNTNEENSSPNQNKNTQNQNFNLSNILSLLGDKNSITNLFSGSSSPQLSMLMNMMSKKKSEVKTSDNNYIKVEDYHLQDLSND